MITQITANELKVKGIALIDELSADNTSVVVTVRGKEKYVILPIEEYYLLREAELDIAIQESKKDIAEGKIFNNSIPDHMKRVCDV